MVQQTANHNLDDYDPATDTTWDHSDLVQKAEERLPVRDIEDNVTDYTAHNNAWFWATDTGAVYEGDGTNWGFSGLYLSFIQADTIKAKKYAEATVTGSISGSTSLDLDQANYFRHTLTGDVTFSFSNPETGTFNANSFILIVEQDGTGGHAITWPTSVEWDSGSAPSLSTSSSAKHLLTFTSSDGGTTWIGIEGPQDIA